MLGRCMTSTLDSYLKGAVLVKNLAAKEPSALSLDTYYKQYYLSLAAAAATIKWYFPTLAFLKFEKRFFILQYSNPKEKYYIFAFDHRVYDPPGCAV